MEARLDKKDMLLPRKTDPAAEACSIAALVGLDEDTAETFTLFLELVGWRCFGFRSASEVDEAEYDLIALDVGSPQRMMFAAERFRWPTALFILVGNPQHLATVLVPDSRLHLLPMPIDLAALEEIVASI